MRIAATAATLLFALASCSTTETRPVNPYLQPNSLMATEINQRIDQIPFQHREELVDNLYWLAQAGEQTIPALLVALHSDNAKVRSSACWVLGRLRDRRTVPALQNLVNDGEASVSMEAARSLVLMGDVQQSPKLIEGLDSDRVEVRYMCHEALKMATGHDFGYDHLNQNQPDLRVAVLRWRQWWGEYSGDQFFAQSYQDEHGLGNLAAPGGETQLQDGASGDASHGDAGSPSDLPDGDVPDGDVPDGDVPDGDVPESTTTPDTSVPAAVEKPEPVGNGQVTSSAEEPTESSVVPVENVEGAKPIKTTNENTIPPSIPPVEVPESAQPETAQPETVQPEQAVEVSSTTSEGATQNGESKPVVQPPVVEVPVVEVPVTTENSGSEHGTGGN